MATGWECVADREWNGLAMCDVCVRLFNPDLTHLELPGAEGGAVVVCAHCVPQFIQFVEEEGPPGLAAALLEVWVS